MSGVTTPRPGSLVLPARDGAPATTTSLVIAEGTDVQHKNVLELIRNNLSDFEEFGGVAFETRPFYTAGGTQEQTLAILTEEHATLLLTYMRNSEVVRDFKKRLVREFWNLRRGAAAQSREERLALAVIDAQQMLAEKDERIAELAPPAAAWNSLAEAEGDYAVADAAKVLSRDPEITLGRDRLFVFMQGLRWVYRDRGWRAYQTQVDCGRLVEKVSKPYWHEGRGELVNGNPTVRITPKGLAELHKRLGGSGQLELVAAVS